MFLHKIRDPQIAREKTFQLASVIQNAQAVGLLATDIPYGSEHLSRFGVEETVVDGVILLSSTEEGLERQRYIEVYKLRNTAQAKGRHSIVIGSGGITIFPRYDVAGDDPLATLSPKAQRRLPSGIPGLDELCDGGILETSVTLVSGSTGIGKSTFGLQFIAGGVKHREAGLYVSFEEGPAQILKAAERLSRPLKAAIAQGLVEVIHLPREQVRASQFLTVLADKIQSRKVRRLVLDGVNQIAGEGQMPKDLRQLLFALVTRFKNLGVTSVLTFEASTMYATGSVTDHGFSPIADNLILLRYIRVSGEDLPSLAVVKTRGSAHDRRTYHLSFADDGIRVGALMAGAVPVKASRGARKQSGR